jgi:prepilin-type processing-associated H-X9-DG protein
VFFSENWKFAGTLGFQGVKRHHTPASIDDGMSNTLLIGENVRTGYDPVRPGVNWSTAWGSQTRFYFNHEVCADHSCTTGSLNFAKANGGGHAINAGRYAAEGESPFLNSFHSGLAVVGFADGRVQFLSESVDGRVYFNLCTPKGIRLKGTPLDAGVTTDGF